MVVKKKKKSASRLIDKAYKQQGKGCVTVVGGGVGRCAMGFIVRKQERQQIQSIHDLSKTIFFKAEDEYKLTENFRLIGYNLERMLGAELIP